MSIKNSLVIIFLIFSFCLADSLWTENSKSAFLKKNTFKIGDTLTVIIDESLNALQQGTTKTSKATNVGLNLTSQADSSTEIRNKKNESKTDDTYRLTTGGSDRYTGSGSTTRKSTLKTTITATVIDTQPNGNIFILGQRQIKLNEEVEQLEISGIVRVKDISDENTILSSQIANIKIALNGNGVVANPQKPGMLSKAFEWLF